MPSSPLLTRRAKHTPKGRHHIVSHHLEVCSSFRPSCTTPTSCVHRVRAVGCTDVSFGGSLLVSSLSLASHRTSRFSSRSSRSRAGPSASGLTPRREAGNGGRATGLSSLLLLRLQHRRKSLLLRAVGRRFKSRGLTRRCSGLAALAAELHFVRRRKNAHDTQP